MLLTGDQRGVGEAVADKLEVDEVGAELLRDGKVAAVKALVAEGRAVAMVGDGVNDAADQTQGRKKRAEGTTCRRVSQRLRYAFRTRSTLSAFSPSGTLRA